MIPIQMTMKQRLHNPICFLFFYYCESTGGSTHTDLGANLVAALSLVDISQLEQSSLIHSSYTIINAVQSKCGIAA